MRLARLLAISTLVGGLSVAPAQSGPLDTEDPPFSEELNQTLREMIDRMKPAIVELMETLKVLENVDGIEHYQRPEILPNGDVIIRRRDDAPPLPEIDAEPESVPGVRT